MVAERKSQEESVYLASGCSKEQLDAANRTHRALHDCVTGSKVRNRCEVEILEAELPNSSNALHLSDYYTLWTSVAKSAIGSLEKEIARKASRRKVEKEDASYSVDTITTSTKEETDMFLTCQSSRTAAPRVRKKIILPA
ncbi:hypothetical protein WN48_08124 [Eufriesea mexicana]|uniref:Uncharacterized protein n=1 Tax=Eufriesea mexicana TaxID=516756 RepID=A0A310S829_9HYME|nr:hypothetical protein WN48_08124 [Eufriesea mexicana]